MADYSDHPERLYRAVGKPGRGATAVGYVRYSSDMQNPATIVTQKRRIQEYAEANGWHLVHWYEEPESSASYEELGKRPIFAQLLNDAGRGFSVVLCYQNDRWSRNTAVSFASLAALRERGIWWATADGLWDIDKVEEDGTDVAFAIDTQVNAAFLRRLSRRAIDAKEDRARDGYHNGSVPFGYLPPDYPKPPDGAPSTWKPPRMPVRRDPVNFPALVRLGELAALGWADAAIADELAGYFTQTPRFGQRPLSKDTVGAMRRMWFPREFAPGCGHGTIETPSGELVEGRHPAAWPYELWQTMVEVKQGQFHRVPSRSRQRTYEFSRILCCAACKQPLRIDTNRGAAYYKDTSRVRKVPCTAFGCLTVGSERVVQQFGTILHSIHLPATWRDGVSEYSHQLARLEGTEQLVARRDELEAEQKRLVLSFAKGYISEDALDCEIARIRSDLLDMPPILPHRTAEGYIQQGVAAGEALGNFSSRWDSASQQERREIVCVLFGTSGLIYDLQRQGIVGLTPHSAVLPVLMLGLSEQWVLRDQTLWLREEHVEAHTVGTRIESDSPPPFRGRRLSPMKRQEALSLVRAGMSPQKVAERLHVSYWVIFRLMKRDEPKLSAQQQPKLSPEQEEEARQMLQQGKSLRAVGSHFGVSYTSIWRMVHRDSKQEKSEIE